MSQSTEPVNVQFLGKGLDTSRTWDPEDTIPVPIAALMAGAAASEQPEADPERDAALAAHQVAARILREAPVPSGISEKWQSGGTFCLEVHLGDDADRSKLGTYAKLYGGQISNVPMGTERSHDDVHSELVTEIDAVKVRVWVLDRLPVLDVAA